MTKCKGDTLKDSVILYYNDNKKKENLKEIILNNYDAFFSYISKLDISITYKDKTSNFQNSSYTKLVLRTTCFKVDFNDNFVKMTAIKKTK